MAQRSHLKHVRHNRFRGLPRNRLDHLEANLSVSTALLAAPAQTAATFANATNDLTVTGHGLTTGMPVILAGAGTPPAEIELVKAYSAIVVDPNTIQLAADVDSALLGNALGFSDDGSAPITVERGTDAASTLMWNELGVTPARLSLLTDIDSLVV